MRKPSDVVSEDRLRNLEQGLERHDSIVHEIKRLSIEQSPSSLRTRKIAEQILAQLCASDEYSILEKAALYAVTHTHDLPRSVDDLTHRAEQAHQRLAYIDEALRDPTAPLLSFEIDKVHKPTHGRPLHDYDFRYSDGKGLVTRETGYGEDGFPMGGRFRTGTPVSYSYTHTVGELDSQVGGYVMNGPLVRQIESHHLLDWAASREQASRNIFDPPQQGARHLLIGHEEIRAFFEKTSYTDRLEPVMGRAAVMGYQIPNRHTSR